MSQQADIEQDQSDSELVKPEQAVVSVTADQLGANLTLIERAIGNPEVDPDKLHSLLDFQERVMAKQAEINFNQAMSRMQLEMPVITKDGSVQYPVDKNNPTAGMQKAFDYASFENIMRTIKPVLQKEGFTLSFDSDQREGGGAVIIGTLAHIDGHSKTASFAAALDTSGGKNNIQAMGSTFSYGKRYCVTSLLNIVTEGEDDDGNTYEDHPIDDAQFSEIQRLIDESGADSAGFCNHMSVGSLREIRQKQYAEATNALKAKIKKNEENAKAQGDTQ